MHQPLLVPQGTQNPPRAPQSQTPTPLAPTTNPNMLEKIGFDEFKSLGQNYNGQSQPQSNVQVPLPHNPNPPLNPLEPLMPPVPLNPPVPSTVSNTRNSGIHNNCNGWSEEMQDNNQLGHTLFVRQIG